jgi:hypothetical protein
MEPKHTINPFQLQLNPKHLRSSQILFSDLIEPQHLRDVKILDFSRSVASYRRYHHRIAARN